MIRIAALVLAAAVFWLDMATPDRLAVPALYVVPLLLFLAGGHYWEPVLAAAIVTILIAVQGGDRRVETLVVWITAGVVARYRRSLGRQTVQVDKDRRARDESTVRLEEMRQALDDAAIVATTDQRGVITYVNDKFTQISKYSRDELIGQDHRIINSNYHSKDFIRELWRTIANGQIWRGEIRNRAKDGLIYWVDTTIVPFLNADGKPRQYLAIRTDITQRKIAEQQLADQSALAQLGQLAAVVAHEVRNPLAGVQGSLQILRSRPSAEPQDRLVIDAMIARLDVLNSKVEDIMRFARPRTPAFEAVDVAAVAMDASVSARAAAGDLCPQIIPPARSTTVLADREMLRAMLLNLLLNACQSGTREPVEIHVTTDEQRCGIEIADRGTGIPEGDIERIFDAFHTTKKSGTGLGLAIVRRFATLQNGAIELQHREGGGTVARVSLPCALDPR